MKLVRTVAARWWGRQDQHQLAEAKVSSEGGTVRIAVFLRPTVDTEVTEDRRYVGAVEIDRAEILNVLGMVNRGHRGAA